MWPVLRLVLPSVTDLHSAGQDLQHMLLSHLLHSVAGWDFLLLALLLCTDDAGQGLLLCTADDGLLCSKDPGQVLPLLLLALLNPDALQSLLVLTSLLPGVADKVLVLLDLLHTDNAAQGPLPIALLLLDLLCPKGAGRVSSYLIFHISSSAPSQCPGSVTSGTKTFTLFIIC